MSDFEATKKEECTCGSKNVDYKIAHMPFCPMSHPPANSNWSSTFDEKFVRDDGLMDKYTYDEDGNPNFIADGIKDFIKNLLQQERQKMIEEIEKLKVENAIENPKLQHNVTLETVLDILKGKE